MLDIRAETASTYTHLQTNGWENGLSRDEFESLSCLPYDDPKQPEGFYDNDYDDEGNEYPLGLLCYSTSYEGMWGTSVHVARDFTPSSIHPWTVYGSEFLPQGHDMEPHMNFGSFATFEYAIALACHIHDSDEFQINVIEEDEERGCYVRGTSIYPDCMPSVGFGTDHVRASTLSDEDLLTALRTGVRDWGDFMIAKLKGTHISDVIGVARNALVFHDRGFVKAGSLVDEIKSRIAWDNSISQAYECELSAQIAHAANQMSEMDRNILWAASGFETDRSTEIRAAYWDWIMSAPTGTEPALFLPATVPAVLATHAAPRTFFNKATAPD